jgi:[protein-PII] uridylyltransferase
MTNLNIKIENLVSNNAKDFEVAKVIKKDIKLYLNSLDDIFNQSSGKDFFVKHTKKIDGFIKVLYKYILRKHFGNYLPMSNSIPITLIALGSYGREQLCVYSDIDIMLLYEDIKGYNTKCIIEEFMVLAWDSGLKLGHRVHRLKDIENEVKQDITIKSSILESRLIYGSKHLWFLFQNKLQNIRKFKQKEFVLEKLDEHKKRLLKYPLKMQPNIKDGYGGMRESNMLFWIANITYGISNTKELTGKLFSEDEYKEYRTALEYIFRIRNALHLISKKKQDNINFDIISELSLKLGFSDTVRLTKERQCMAKVLLSLHIIHRFTASMVKKITRYYIFDKKNITKLREARYKKNIYICNNILYTSYWRKQISFNNLLKELILLPNNINKFDNSYQYFVSKTIKPKILSTTTIKNIYTLLQKQNLSPAIKLLYNTKLLRVILPSLNKIINQAQFDGYHIHPVDIHTLKTLWYIENIKDSFVKNLYNTFTQKEQFLLKLLALFHDSGKGRQKDHRIVGEKLFKKFAKLFSLEDELTILGAKIIRYHTTMSKVATTEDIYAQDTILHFTATLGSLKTLKLLFVLTYADINAVGERIYSSHTASLLRELYLQSIDTFENKELLKESSRRVAKENTIKKLPLFLEQTKKIQKKILTISSLQLFLKYKASDIIKISLYAHTTNNFYITISNEDILTIRITRVVPLNLGYLLGKLSFLNITSMGIYKLFDGKKFFEITFNTTVHEDDLLYIKEIIDNSFDMDKIIKIKKPNIEKKDIKINCNHTNTLAKIQINTKDQKGLFAYIAQTFDKFDIEINSAKIFTKNNKVNDLLILEKNGNFCINQDKIIKELTT